MRQPLSAVVLVLATAFAAPAGAQDPLPVNQATEAAFARLGAHPGMRQALDFVRADDERALKDQVELTEIPAPPFKEAARAAEYAKRLKAAGLADVRIDPEGNVIALRHGSGRGPVLVVCAHLDTVFPEGTDVKVKVRDNRYAAPGIGDDGRGLASLLSIVRAMNHANLRTVADIVFLGSVGEEGLGDLRGVKAFFREHRNVDGFIAFDGLQIDRIVYQATGSRRWRIAYTGPGGHSFSAFGMPSATHALGRAIAKIADVRTPDHPKTTFTVGTVQGGTSVNAIAAEAELGLDIRSDSPEELKKLEDRIQQLAREAASEENARWNQRDLVKVDFKLLGDRPAGIASADSALVHAARRGVQAAGGEVHALVASSTDANLPISLGIPAMTLGSGGIGAGAHSPEEWYSPVHAWRGPQMQLWTILALAGVEGVTQPLLQKRAAP